MDKPQRSNNWNLFTGLLLTFFGSFRVYQHFSEITTLGNFRLILSISFIGYGLFNLYQYFQNKK